MTKKPRKLRKPNQKTEEGKVEVIGDNAAAQLGSFYRRIENLMDDRQAVNDDMRELYAEAKSQGFDTKIMRKVVARRRRDRKEVQEEDAMLELYEGAAMRAEALGDEYENQDE